MDKQDDGLGAWLSFLVAVAGAASFYWWGAHDWISVWMVLGDRIGLYMGATFLLGATLGYVLSGWHPKVDLSWTRHFRPDSDPRWREFWDKKK